MLQGPTWDDNICHIELLKKLIEFDENHSYIFHFDQLLPSGKSFFTNIIAYRARELDRIKTDNFPEDLKQIHALKGSSFGSLIRFLLEKGVDPNKPAAFGVYPFQYAITDGN